MTTISLTSTTGTGFLETDFNQLKTLIDGLADNSISLNNAKISYNSTDSTKVGFISVTQAVNLDTMESNIATNNAKISYSSAASDAVALNTAKVTNATHTGEVTGSGALTVDKTAITGKDAVTIASTDYVLISDTSDSGNLKKGLISDISGGAGYTNLTEFVDQTAYRLFYSDASGDVTELALGANGTFLQSNGASAAPTFAVPAGSGNVSTSGSPVDNDFAKFVSATDIEGRSYSEVRTDLGLVIGTNVQAWDTILDGTTASFTTTLESNIGTNNSKVTNATHTGEVTGATALTIADNVIDEANLKLDTAPTNDFVLTADSTKSGGMKWSAVAGTGDVVGPSSAVDENITVFDSTTGKLVKDSGVNISAVTTNTAKVTNATHSGDATGDTTLTLATVNSNVGSFTNANITVNAKGLVTAASNGSGGTGGSPAGIDGQFQMKDDTDFAATNFYTVNTVAEFQAALADTSFLYKEIYLGIYMSQTANTTYSCYGTSNIHGNFNAASYNMTFNRASGTGSYVKFKDTVVFEDDSSLTITLEASTNMRVYISYLARDYSGSGLATLTWTIGSGAIARYQSNDGFDVTGVTKSHLSYNYESYTGVDLDAVTGTAGTSGNLAVWNADGDLVDGGAVPSSPLTTKGDIYTYNGLDADARLPVGTNGQVLSSDSTAATGLNWIDASGSGTVTSVAAGNGLDFTTITGSGSVTMGTPGALDADTTNGVTTTSHTHTITTGISDNNIVQIDSVSVADNEYARFTANGLESRSNAEVLSDIGAGTMSNLSDDTTPELSGELDAGANTIGFTLTDNGNSSTADTIDWGNSNKQKSTLTGNCTFTFTAPANPCAIQLLLVQDGTGSRTVTWPASVKWSGGTAPTLTTTASGVDIITFLYDGTNYYGASILNFS